MLARLLIFALFASTTLFSQAKKPLNTNGTAAVSERSVEPLPVKKVVLYKNGVGYFEHTGRVRGSQEVDVDFTTSQMNDVLKSLAVVDLGGGRVSSVRYNSVAPLNERLKTLRLPLDGQTNSYQFLNALRGAKVEVRSGSTIAVGHLLSVERKQQRRDNVVTDSDFVSIVSDAGDIRVFEIGAGTSVHILDRDLSKEVSRYMDLVSSTREKDVRRMTISTEGSGERELFVSYISEVPVWKSTYRVILPQKPGDKAILQGWAIVDNTVGEDWKDVQLSLVAGAPQSFVQNLAQPYYTQRPVIELPEFAQLTPQTHEGTMEEEQSKPAAPESAAAQAGGSVGGLTAAPAYSGGVGSGSGGGYGGGVFRADGRVAPGTGISGTVVDPVGAVIPNATVSATDASGRMVASTAANSQGYFSLSTPPGNMQLRTTAPGFSETGMSVTVTSGQMRSVHPVLRPGAADTSVEVSASLEPGAEGKPLAEMFEYKLKEKVTIGKNQSALVPIISAKVDAEKVTLWNSGSEHPVRALWLKNSSGLTLDGGTFNVLEQGSFGGEGIWEIMKPEERRLISYAAEDAIRVQKNDEVKEGKVSHVKIDKGVMIQTQRKENKTVYKIRNEDSSPRVVVIEHPNQEGWKLASELKPEETTKDYRRFKVEVAPKSTKEFPVVETNDVITKLALTNFSDRDVAFFVQRRSLTPEMEKALRQVLDKKRVVNDIDTQIGTRQREMTKISQDQNRVRENMKALKGSSEEKQLIQRYTRDLNAQEDRLDALRKEVEQLESKHQAAQEELEAVIEGISLESDIGASD